MVQKNVQINESKVRLIAFVVFALTLFYLFSNVLIVPLFLVLDFLLRSFNLAKFSVIGLLSDKAIRLFKLPFKPVYYPPKRFAARIGLVFSFLICLFHVGNLNTIILATVLAFFAFLESFFGFCAGCYVYNIFVRK